MNRLYIRFSGMIANVMQPDGADALVLNTEHMHDEHVPRIRVMSRGEVRTEELRGVEIEIEAEGEAAGPLDVDDSFLKRTLALDELHPSSGVGRVAPGAVADHPDPGLVVGRMRLRRGGLYYRATTAVELAKFDIVKSGDPDHEVKTDLDIAEESSLVIPFEGDRVVVRLRRFRTGELVFEETAHVMDDHQVRIHVSNEPRVERMNSASGAPLLHHFMGFYHLAGEPIEPSEMLVPRIRDEDIPNVIGIKCDGCWPACSNARFAPPA